MSTPFFEVTVVELHSDGKRARFRLRPIASPEDRAVTRSFVVRMLGADPELVDEDQAPSAMVHAVRSAGIDAWPDTPDEATASYAPIIGKLVTSTRVIEGVVDGTYDLEVEVPEAPFLRGLQVGLTFNTYAQDVWYEDPKNPLASDEQRAAWAAKVRETSATEEHRNRTHVDEQAGPVERWLARIDDAGMIAVAPASRRSVARKLVALIDRAENPDEAARAVVDFLMESDAVDEVFVDDGELVASIAPLLGATSTR